MRANKDIHNITWVPSENQVANVFMKKGVPSSKILQHMIGTKAVSISLTSEEDKKWEEQVWDCSRCYLRCA